MTGLPKMRRVLVIAAHADDEVLGVGGTIARHALEGDRVDVAFMTDGVSSRGYSSTESEARAEAAHEALTRLDAHLVHWSSFPDNAMDTVSLLAIIKVVEEIKKQSRPDIVYTHHDGDLNIDHVVTARAVLTAFRPQPHETYTEIRAFEVLSSTGWSTSSPFVPDTYIDITSTRDRLLAAYDAYRVEQRPDPHARSRFALETKIAHRGREVGVTAAEAFRTIRRIVRPNPPQEDS